MQIDWDKTIEEILAEKTACPRCGSFTEDLVAGYTRETWGTEYAPRCHFCTRKENCDSRKLVVLCEACARELRLRSRHVDQPGLMNILLNDCRKDLEECLDYVAEFWQEDLDVPPEDAEKSLEEFAPKAFEEERVSRVRLVSRTPRSRSRPVLARGICRRAARTRLSDAARGLTRSLPHPSLTGDAYRERHLCRFGCSTGSLRDHTSQRSLPRSPHAAVKTERHGRPGYSHRAAPLR